MGQNLWILPRKMNMTPIGLLSSNLLEINMDELTTDDHDHDSIQPCQDRNV
jgi:hypothetical protein